MRFRARDLVGAPPRPGVSPWARSVLAAVFLLAAAAASFAQAQRVVLTYDTLNRLVSISYPDRTIVYTYDAAGNRLSTTVQLLNPAPTVTGVMPSAGPLAGGISITITGTGFRTGAAVTVGGVAATNVVVLDATTITATTPGHAAGPVDVVVHNTDGQSGSRTSGFTYVPQPTVTAVTPSGGRVTGETPIAITGTNFIAGATVTLGGTAATSVVVVNPTTITAVTPTKPAGPVTVAVTTAGGSGSLPGGFTYVPMPVFTDPVLMAGTTSLRAVHVSELRQRVNELRARYALPAFAWTDAVLTPGQTVVKAVHVTELRTALGAVAVSAGLPLPTYTRPVLTPGNTTVAAIDIGELRQAVLALW